MHKLMVIALMLCSSQAAFGYYSEDHVLTRREFNEMMEERDRQHEFNVLTNYGYGH